MAFKNLFSLACLFLRSIGIQSLGFCNLGDWRAISTPDGESDQSVHNLIRLINTERAGPISGNRPGVLIGGNRNHQTLRQAIKNF